jgi:serine/threonine protein kinase
MGCASSAPKGGSDFHRDYMLSKKLGEGSFAQVFVCQDRSSRENLAVKVLDVAGGANVRKDARKEAQLWQRTSGSPYCVNLLNFFEDNKFCYMVMEQCTCTVLEAFLKYDDTGEDELAHCFRGMLEGLRHVHSRGVVHRDVKPDNFLLEGTKFSEDSVVKLCDFGLAAAMPRKTEGKKSLLNKSSALTDICGTAPYMAPEMLMTKSGGYDTAVDIWAVGVSAYLLLFGEYPYRPKQTGSKEMMDAIREGKKPSYQARSGFPQPSQMACDFVHGILDQRSATNRPDADEAMQKYFLKRLVRTPVQQKTVEPEAQYVRKDTRKQSFHQTLKVAQTVANQECLVHLVRGGEVVRFPTPEIKENFEKALREMQKEFGGTVGTLRNEKRTMSGPSRTLSQVTFSDVNIIIDDASSGRQDFTGRSKSRHSTHSGSFYLPSDKDVESGSTSGSDGGESTRASSRDEDRDIAQLQEPDMWVFSEPENAKTACAL